MDIDLLSKMVRELILDHDTVTLPGVGSFVAELVPSAFSDRGYTINPPYRRLFFRPREEGDTVLVELYARSNRLDYATAESLLRSYLSEMKELLMEKKTVVFPSLGRLRATKENNFFFIADEDLNIYPDGFGLQPVSLKTHVETADEVSAAVASLRSILDDGQVPSANSQTETVPAVAAESEPGVDTESGLQAESVSDPNPEPVSEPVTDQDQEQSPEQVSEPKPELEPELKPEPVLEAVPEPVSGPNSEPGLKPEQETVPEAESSPDSSRKKAVSEKEAISEKNAVSGKEAVSEKDAVEAMFVMAPARTSGSRHSRHGRYSPHRGRRTRRMRRAGRTWKAVGLILLFLALFIIAFALAGRLAPDFVDRILYSEEELEILRHVFTLNM